MGSSARTRSQVPAPVRGSPAHHARPLVSGGAGAPADTGWAGASPWVTGRERPHDGKALTGDLHGATSRHSAPYGMLARSACRRFFPSHNNPSTPRVLQHPVV